ncbi:hypothetical protein D3C73_470790 [compost metagenome]
MKAKITMTIEWEYEINPEHYKDIMTVPVGTDQDRLNYDVNAIRIDPWVLLENGEWQVRDVKGEMIAGEANTHE